VAIFVDTGGWYAASVPGDPDHVAAVTFLRSNSERLVTTDFIYDELLTLFRARGQAKRARDWVSQIDAGYCDFVQVTADDIPAATEIYFRFADKSWSFTDCTSFVVIERLAIRHAFSFDDHFRQFGNVIVVP
jgi:predicted nucleic acid-binding protein